MTTNFEIQELPMEGVKLITPFYMEDSRGYFLKSLEKDIFKEWGLDAEIQEDFETYSKKGVIRGLHFQTQHPQVKMVRVLKGKVHDVVVDLRKGSKSFGRYEEVALDDRSHSILWVPAGFAHGFEVLSQDAVVSYKCIGKYFKGYDTGICWNDKDISVRWETGNPIVSEKDAGLMSLREFSDKYSGL